MFHHRLRFERSTREDPPFFIFKNISLFTCINKYYYYICTVYKQLTEVYMIAIAYFIVLSLIILLFICAIALCYLVAKARKKFGSCEEILRDIYQSNNLKN